MIKEKKLAQGAGGNSIIVFLKPINYAEQRGPIVTKERDQRESKRNRNQERRRDEAGIIQPLSPEGC